MAVRLAQQELLTLSLPQMFLAGPIMVDGGVSRDVGRSSGRMVIDMVEHWIAQPFVDRGGPPAYTAGVELDVLRKGTVGHLAVKGGPAKSGLVEHGPQAQDAVGVGGHGITSRFLGRELPRSCFCLIGSRASLRS